MTNDQWQQLLKLEHEFQKRGLVLSWRKIQEAMRCSYSAARDYDRYLKNKEVISGRFKEEVFDDERVAVLCDIHIPFQDDVAIEAALGYIDAYRPGVIVLLGDIIDCYRLSRFMKKTGNHSVREELMQCRKFLANLRDRYPEAKIIYKEGNHESHLERYIMEQAFEIADLLDGLMSEKLGLNELGIEYRVPHFSLGKLWYMHGHEKSGGGAAEYITNVVFKQTIDHTIFGHHHRVQEKIFKRIGGDTLWCGGVGHLAGPMEYAPINSWIQGFATVTYNGAGRFRARLLKIQDGIIY